MTFSKLYKTDTLLPRSSINISIFLFFSSSFLLKVILYFAKLELLFKISFISSYFASVNLQNLAPTSVLSQRGTNVAPTWHQRPPTSVAPMWHGTTVAWHGTFNGAPTSVLSCRKSKGIFQTCGKSQIIVGRQRVWQRVSEHFENKLQ